MRHSYGNRIINTPDASVGVCCSHKVVAVGFNTLCYDAASQRSFKRRRGIKPSARIKYHDNEHMSIDKFYDRVRKNEYRRRMPESALAGKGKHIMRCEKLLKNIFIVRDPPTPAWSTAKRPRVSADEGYRSAEGGFFRYAPSEKRMYLS